MSLVDLKSKHSLLGDGTNGQPISEMANNVGPEFANFRNIRYNSSPEPSQGDSPIWPNEWDSHLETLLVQEYSYDHSGEDSVVVPASDNTTAGGYLHFADLYEGVPPVQTFGTRGTHPYNGVDNGPSDGFYWL